MPSGRTVAHYIHNHLVATEGWISDQISFLKRTRSFVLAKRLSAPLVSADVPVYALSSLGRMQRAASECMHATTAGRTLSTTSISALRTPHASRYASRSCRSTKADRLTDPTSRCMRQRKLRRLRNGV